MIDLEKKSSAMVKLFAPKQITTKSETFVVQGSLLDVDDPNYCIKLRLEGKGQSLCDMIIKEFNLPNDAVVIADPNWDYGEDIMVLNAFASGINFEVAELNQNYIKVTIYWIDFVYDVQEVSLDDIAFRCRRNRKRNANR